MRKKLIIAIIGFWIIFYAINNYCWLKNSVDFPHETMGALKYSHMIRWFNLLKNFNFNELKWGLIRRNVEPLYFLPAAISSVAFGAKYHFHIMLNIIYFALLLISVYLLCKEICNENCGVIAVSLLSLYPGIYGFSRKFFREFGIMWIVAFAVFFLIKSRLFANRKYSIIAGIFLGLGLMTHGVFALFVLGPLIYVGFQIFKKLKEGSGEISGKNFLNLSLSLLVCLLISGYRYLRQSVIYHHLMQFVSVSEGFQPFVCTEFLINGELYLLFSILFIVSSIYLLIKRDKRDQIIFPLLWFLIPFLYLSLMLHQRQSHHLVPLLPPVAVISALYLDDIKRKHLRTILVYSLITLGLFQYYYLSFDTESVFHRLRLSKSKRFAGTVHRPIPPEQNIHNNIINIISTEVNMTKKSTVLLLPAKPRGEEIFFDYWTWKNILWLKKLPFKIFDVVCDNFENLPGYIAQADIILNAGDADLKDKTALEHYLNRLVEGYVGFVKFHPCFYDTKSRKAIYKEVLKGNYEVLFPEGSIEQIKSKIKQEFSFFELKRAKILSFDTKERINLFIYTRKD